MTNAGPSTATNATITDTLPATFTNVSFTATATGGLRASGQRAGQRRQHGHDAAGQYDHLPGHWHGQPHGNRQRVEYRERRSPGGTTDPNTTNNSATDTDTFAAPQADLQVTSPMARQPSCQAQVASYTIVLTNAGPSNATGVVIADTLPATFSNISFTATATGGASGFWASVPAT